MCPFNALYIKSFYSFYFVCYLFTILRETAFNMSSNLVGFMFINFQKILIAVVFSLASSLITLIGAQAQSNIQTTTTQANLGAILVNVNMARVLRINAPAATVIIGNPGIADVTIQDSQTLILTGKSYGQTNLIVLDSAGNPIADTLIEVIQTSDDVVTVYMGLARITLACEPVCQPTATLGDDTTYTSQSISSADLIENAAQ